LSTTKNQKPKTKNQKPKTVNRRHLALVEMLPVRLKHAKTYGELHLWVEGARLVMACISWR